MVVGQFERNLNHPSFRLDAAIIRGIAPAKEIAGREKYL